ncbi:uncharacterized protein LOC108738585 [Agrilus planipennis]|uniref:Uncharacterized protein LOC108738585 n=1 Tax=Agrilus planipennis TaxID=224129 RepID=A0A1W4X5A4_AGRPL|nr:uncharacterized protein LOC108738585 [Agrilus planipennis]
MYKFPMVVLFSITYFGQCIIPAVESKATACDPKRKDPTYKDSKMTCAECSCVKNGKALVCTENRCKWNDGTTVNKYGVDFDLPVVKLCEPGMSVYNNCNVCTCGTNYQPTICHLITCNARLLELMTKSNPNYPFLEKS